MEMQVPAFRRAAQARAAALSDLFVSRVGWACVRKGRGERLV